MQRGCGLFDAAGPAVARCQGRARGRKRRTGGGPTGSYTLDTVSGRPSISAVAPPRPTSPGTPPARTPAGARGSPQALSRPTAPPARPKPLWRGEGPSHELRSSAKAAARHGGMCGAGGHGRAEGQRREGDRRLNRCPWLRVASKGWGPPSVRIEVFVTAPMCPTAISWRGSMQARRSGPPQHIGRATT